MNNPFNESNEKSGLRPISNGVNTDSPSPENRTGLRDSLVRTHSVSRFSKLEQMTRALSPFERLVLYILTATLGASAFALLAGANNAVSVRVPSHGGVLVEGQLGPARFINPLIPMSQADSDLVALVYSGLTRAMPDGRIVPDLASSYEISPDGTTYTFTLRDNAIFHDGTRVTSADVLFTIQKAQNPDIKSVHRADWEGVSVSTPDERTVVFKLPRAYAPFIQNTAMGILPSHLWRDVTAEEFPFSPLNINPVGSGSFKVAKVETSPTGSATRYDLEAFADFTLGGPYLRRISFVFYPNEGALIRGFNRGEVDSMAGISPDELDSLERKDVLIRTVPLPRVFGVFLNQGRNATLADAAVRNALDAAVVKQRVVDGVLRGYGVAVESPVPPHVLSWSDASSSQPVSAAVSEVYTDDSIGNARGFLERGGWKWSEESGSWTKGTQTLAFTLSTADSPELVATVNAVADAWRRLGAQVQVQLYPISELNTNVIRPREYDAILFGEVVGRELDLFAFWHSSQRNDPGLNLALYANSRADALLSEARTTTDAKKRTELYQEFAGIVQKDVPAIFLYSPEFVYAVPHDLSGVELGILTTPSERFLTAHTWYTDTENVWSIFARESEESI